MSVNGPDLSTYRKIIIWQELVVFKYKDLIFGSISILLNKFSFSFFIYQLIVKSFLFGFNFS